MRAALGAVVASALLRRGPAAPPRVAEALKAADEAVWEGLDDDSPLVDDAAPSETISLLRVKGRPYAIAGQYDTGTNLLQKLMESHLKAAKRIDQEPHKQEDAGHYFWKHTKPENINPEVRKSVNQTVALVMVRDPLSWLQSLKKAPYDLKKCVKQKRWLTSSCKSPPTITDWIGHPDKMARTPPRRLLYLPQKEVYLPDLESFWNEWTSDYTHMADFGFADALVIRYEDLVVETETQLKRIAKFLDIPPPGEVVPLKTAAKGHGHPLGRDAALKKIREKPYLSLYSSTDRREVCKRLNATLLRRFNYTDCL